MLCFTSPTIRLPLLLLMQSSSSTLKLSHCRAPVSWNSSIMMLWSGAPIFSKMNGLSLPLIIPLRMPWVSLSRKRLDSLLSVRIVASILPRRRSWLRFSSVVATDL